ncbi:hypothetical protein EMIT0162MI3_11239 [Pseudomonas chlororaphis]
MHCFNASYSRLPYITCPFIYLSPDTDLT